MAGGLLFTAVLLFLCIGCEILLPESVAAKLMLVPCVEEEEQSQTKEKSPQCWHTAGDKEKRHYGYYTTCSEECQECAKYAG